MKFEKYIERIPTWALCYIINGDSTGITEEEVTMIDSWLKQSGYEVISPIYNCESFSNYPAFGLPCDIIECECLIRNN